MVGRKPRGGPHVGRHAATKLRVLGRGAVAEGVGVDDWDISCCAVGGLYKVRRSYLIRLVVVGAE